MDMLLHTAFWVGLGKIIWVNLLLSGDNARLPSSRQIRAADRASRLRAV